jgi:predicted  nucleic acid-binding Zn-ribbon protein
VQTQEHERMQATINELREEIETLKKEKKSLKTANARIKKQKDGIKKSKKETKGALQMKCKVTEKAAQKLQKDIEDYMAQLETKDQQLQEQNQQLEEQDKRYNALLEEDDEDRAKLVDLNEKLMRQVAGSSRMDYQVRDEALRDAMDSTYMAIHDCFYNLLRKKGPSHATSQHLEPYPINFSADIDVSLAEWQEDLDTYVPGHKDNNKKDKLYLCIATVGRVLVAAVKAEMVFGYPCTDQIEAATICWKQMPGKDTLSAISRRREMTNILCRTSESRGTKEDCAMALAHQRYPYGQGPSNDEKRAEDTLGRGLGQITGTPGGTDRSQSRCQHPR